MKIAILDYENRRAIISPIPVWLEEIEQESENASLSIGDAVLAALGLSSDTTDYMIGEFDVQDCKIENLTADFKADVLEEIESQDENDD